MSLDGFPLYEPFHLKVLLSPTSLLDPSIVAGLDVHAGGYTAEFGDRMSAVIDATSVHPDAEQQYQLGLSLYNASLFAFNRFDDGRGQWLVAARRSNLDEIADLVDASYGELRYSDAFARVDYAFTPDTRGSLHVLASNDRADVTNALDTESAEATYRNSYVWGTVEHDFSSALTARAIASYTYVKTTARARWTRKTCAPVSPTTTVTTTCAGLMLAATYRTDRWLTRFGGELRWLDATYDYSSTVHFEPGYPFPGSGGDHPRRTTSRRRRPAGTTRSTPRVACASPTL